MPASTAMGASRHASRLFQPTFTEYFGKSEFSAIVRPGHAGRATAAAG
jgi:hypothetical protein